MGMLEEQAVQRKTGLDQFLTDTDAEKKLEKMLRGTDADIDLALVNWLMVADIPEFNGFRRQAYFAQLDAMTEQVRRDMARMQASGYAGTDSDDPKTRCQRFSSAMNGSVLNGP